MDKTYPNTQLYINGIWKDADSSETIEVINPAFENIIGKVAHARKPDLEEAIYAADSAFKKWKSVNSFERYKILQNAIRSYIKGMIYLQKSSEGKRH